MSKSENEYGVRDYARRREKLSGWFYETALPNEYFVRMCTGKPQPILGGRRLRLESQRIELQTERQIEQEKNQLREVGEMELKTERSQREIAQHYSPEYLRARAIETLPKVASEMKVDRYTVVFPCFLDSLSH